MKSVVITGSTRGIGLGLAKEFLRAGHAVTVSGRTAASVEGAVRELSDGADASRLAGVPCDVTRIADVERLWALASERFGKVDVWINNAGVVNEHARHALVDVPAGELASIVETNVVGALYGSKVALAGMRRQGFGALYNMEGFGSRGRQFRTGLTPYGTTKAAVRYLTEALAREERGSSLVVGSISPGMVVTDLLLGPYRDHPEELASVRKVFNVLADKVETVAPWIVSRILANEKTGVRIAWLTTPKVLGRFLRAPFARRDVLSPGSPS